MIDFSDSDSMTIAAARDMASRISIVDHIHAFVRMLVELGVTILSKPKFVRELAMVRSAAGVRHGHAGTTLGF
jgi:hypothetical protein